MFERLKRALSGSAPEPPPPSAAPAEPGRLDWITEDTPYRFRTWLQDPAKRGDAVRILEQRLGDELSASVADEPDGRIRLEMISTHRGWLAITRPLSILRGEAVHVRGLEVLDLVEDVPEAELARILVAREAKATHAVADRRMDALAGEAMVRLGIEANRREGGRSAWRFVASSAARWTPGVDRLLLEAALAEPNPSTAAFYGETVALGGERAALVSDPFEPPPELVVALAQQHDLRAEAAYRIANALPAPLPGDLTAVLCAAVRRGGLSDSSAVQALRNAEPTDEVRSALETALESSDTDMSGMAFDSLARLLGTGARPYWEAGLASNSAPRRMAAEDTIGEYGDAGDVPLAAEHLGRIIRRKSTIEWQPPRGSEIIGLLVRHRDLPEAQAALADLSKRWARLPGELQRWLKEHHADLVPAGEHPDEHADEHADGPFDDDDGDAEPPLTWPFPEIKRDGDQYSIGFWDTDTFEIRERFEELLDERPEVTVVDGDREWLTATIDSQDPEALIAELWERAQESPTS
jgi:hypothetical protein